MEELPYFDLYGDQFDDTLAHCSYARADSLATGDEIELLQINKVRSAIEGDRVTDLETLLGNCATWLPREGPGLVHLAVKAKALHCLKFLVQEGKLPMKEGKPAVDGVNKKNLTPLFNAIIEEWFEGVSVLLEAKADIQGEYGGQKTEVYLLNNQTSGKKWTGEKTALQLAVGFESVQILQAVVNQIRTKNDYKAIINVVRSAYKMTPLMIAVTRNKPDFVEILLKNGADVTLLNQAGLSVLHLAVKERFHSIIKLLFTEKSEDVKKLSKIKYRGRFKGTPLLLAVHQKDFKSFKFLADVVGASLLDRCETDVSKDRKKCSVLHLAALSGEKKIIDYLIPLLKANLKELLAAKTESGSTPLKFAFKMRQMKFAHALLAAGADLTTQGADGRTDMDALIYYLESPVQFMTDVLNRSIKKDYRKRFVVAKYTVLMPDNCCQSDGGHDRSNENQATAPVALVSPESDMTQSGVHRNGTIDNRINDEVDIPLLDRTNTRRNHDTQHLAPSNPRSQSEPAGSYISQEGEVAINMPNEQNPSEPSVVQKQNHFGVLRELEKMGDVLKQMGILEHPLVESYLYLYWRKIRGPYMVLLGLNFIFGVLLIIVSGISIAMYVNSHGDDFGNSDERQENTTADFQYDVHSDIWLKVLVIISMLPLLVYEVQCFYTRDRPLRYWLQSAMELLCFCATIGWLVTNQPTPFLIAFFMSWIHFGLLILNLRQCHGCGRVVVHFMKTISGLRDVLFGVLIGCASVIVWGGGSDYFILKFKGVDNSDIVLASTVFSVMMLLCIICFLCFLLILVYSIINFNDNFILKAKNELIIQQINFLEFYEKCLLNKKPRKLAVGDRGMIYYIYKWIGISLNHLAKLCCKDRELISWNQFEVVKREYHVYSNYLNTTAGTRGHPSTEGNNQETTNSNERKVIFPKELELEIFIMEKKNSENVTAKSKASANESILHEIRSMIMKLRQ